MMMFRIIPGRQGPWLFGAVAGYEGAPVGNRSPQARRTPRYDDRVTTPAGSRLLSRNIVGAELLALVETHGRPLFLYDRKLAELDGSQWEIWHPVADAQKGRSPEGRLIVNVQFSDGRDDVVLNGDEAVVIATLGSAAMRIARWP
jgi:hypothetical protein